MRWQSSALVCSSFNYLLDGNVAVIANSYHSWYLQACHSSENPQPALIITNVYFSWESECGWRLPFEVSIKKAASRGTLFTQLPRTKLFASITAFEFVGGVQLQITPSDLAIQRKNSISKDGICFQISPDHAVANLVSIPHNRWDIHNHRSHSFACRSFCFYLLSSLSFLPAAIAEADHNAHGVSYKPAL